MFCKKILCFDLDMTLLDHKTYRVSDKVLLALRKLQQDGHVVTIATGRDMDSEFSIAFARQINPTAIVHSNGQKVAVEGKVIREIFMDKELIRQLMEFARANGLCVGFNIGDSGCYVNKEIAMEQDRKFFGVTGRHYIDESNLLTHPLYALAYFGPPEGAAMIEKAFPELKLPLFSGNIGADIIRKEVSKANGIQALLDYYKMGWEDVIAFGDSMNDYEMIEQAGTGIAMGNAVEPLKEIADFVTLSVEEDGVCYGLEHLGLL